ncbi:MAG: TonB system transport protein ExbD [Tabrizicola sp.]
MAFRTSLTDDTEDEIAEINVTPFIDVMLVLLIVFMIAAPISTVDVAVNLPASSAPPADRPEEPLWLTLAYDGQLRLGETVISSESLVPELDAATNGKRDTPIYLRADRAIAYGKLMALLDLLRDGGYLKIALVGLDGGGVGNP